MDRGYELTELQLLYADTATIKNYCRTNLVARNICNSKDFWLEKFYIDNVPIIGLNVNNKTTGKDYMKEYIRVSRALDGAASITNYIITSQMYKSIHFYMDMDDLNYLKMFPIELQDYILEQKEKLQIPTETLVSLDWGKKIKNNLSHDIIDKKGGVFIGLHLIGHIPDTFDFLTKLFYYYPNIKIQNSAWQSIPH